MESVQNNLAAASFGLSDGGSSRGVSHSMRKLSKAMESDIDEDERNLVDEFQKEEQPFDMANIQERDLSGNKSK